MSIASKTKRRREYHKNKLGQAPGIYLSAPKGNGHAEQEPVSFSVLVYDAHHTEHYENISLERAKTLLESHQHVWLNLAGELDEAWLTYLADKWRLSPLTLEDLHNHSQRPKVEHTEHYSYWVLPMLSLEEDQKTEPAEKKKQKGNGKLQLPNVVYEQLQLIIIDTNVITIQPYAGDNFEPLRQRLLAQQRRRFLEFGAKYLAYAICDLLVDHYFIVLGHIEEALEYQERVLLKDNGRRRALLNKLYHYKGLTSQLRHMVAPTYDSIASLIEGDEQWGSEGMQVFLHDLVDHLAQVKDQVYSLNDTVDSQVDLLLSMINYRSNEIMQFLTLVSTVFIPMTFIASIYGMNFQRMPELNEPWGYPVALGLMLVTGGGFLAFFRLKRWI